jgi:hypothetical protein
MQTQAAQFFPAILGCSEKHLLFRAARNTIWALRVHYLSQVFFVFVSVVSVVTPGHSTFSILLEEDN